jgi:hypothetical protein
VIHVEGSRKAHGRRVTERTDIISVVDESDETSRGSGRYSEREAR